MLRVWLLTAYTTRVQTGKSGRSGLAVSRVASIETAAGKGERVRAIHALQVSLYITSKLVDDV